MTFTPLSLPHLTEALAFDPRTAKQDRILLDIKGWMVEGTTEQFSQFAHELSGQIAFAEGVHRLFNNNSGRTTSWPRWRVTGNGRKSGLRLADGTPLFSGSVRGRSSSSVQQVARTTWHLKAELSLNPTRWLRSQAERDPSVFTADQVRMFSREARLQFEDEKPLVSGTNFIIGRRMALMGGPELWPVQLRRYYEAVLNTLAAAFRHAASASGVTIDAPELTFAIREIETYWEFQTENPIAAVQELEHPLRSLVSRSHVRWREISAEAKPLVQVGAFENTPVLRLKLAAGTEARIYAKTTRRVRFEIVRKTREVRDSYTARTQDAFYGWLASAATHASERLTALMLAHGRMSEMVSSPAFPKYRLVVDIYAHVVDKALAVQLVYQLAHNGRLVRHEGTALGQAIDRLKGQGIVQRANQTGTDQIYHVTEQYQSGLAAIRMML